MRASSSSPVKAGITSPMQLSTAGTVEPTRMPAVITVSPLAMRATNRTWSLQAHRRATRSPAPRWCRACLPVTSVWIMAVLDRSPALIGLMRSRYMHHAACKLGGGQRLRRCGMGY